MIVVSKKRIVYLATVLMISFVVILANGVTYGNSNKVWHTIILDARASVSQMAER